jgi:hypothetical protein
MLAYAFLWEHSYKRLQLAQLLGQLGVFLTLARFLRFQFLPGLAQIAGRGRGDLQ